MTSSSTHRRLLASLLVAALALFAAAVELRREMTTPASPATAPDSVNSTSLTRLTRRPEKYDASSFAPIA